MAHRYTITTTIALTDLAESFLIDDSGRALVFDRKVLSPLVSINGFYGDAKGGMHYTYINVETGESFDQ